MPFPLRAARVAVWLSLAGALACRHPSSSSARAATRHASEANVVAIILAANNANLSYARLASERARHPDVLAFAERMSTDHTLLNAVVVQLASSLDIAPQDDATSIGLRDASTTARDALRGLRGRAFESTYIANEVQFHKNLLVTIDDVLVPSVRRPELRQYLTNLRPAVSAHLAHAEQVRASLPAYK